MTAVKCIKAHCCQYVFQRCQNTVLWIHVSKVSRYNALNKWFSKVSRHTPVKSLASKVSRHTPINTCGKHHKAPGGAALSLDSWGRHQIVRVNQAATTTSRSSSRTCHTKFSELQLSLPWHRRRLAYFPGLTSPGKYQHLELLLEKYGATLEHRRHNPWAKMVRPFSTDGNTLENRW